MRRGRAAFVRLTFKPRVGWAHFQAPRETSQSEATFGKDFSFCTPEIRAIRVPIVELTCL